MREQFSTLYLDQTSCLSSWIMRDDFDIQAAALWMYRIGGSCIDLGRRFVRPSSALDSFKLATVSLVDNGMLYNR